MCHALVFRTRPGSRAPWIRTVLGVLGSLLLVPASLPAEVSLPSLITDHMVLQQQETVGIWGWADPGETVTVTSSWSPAVATSVAATADADGRWRVSLRTPVAGGPHSITIAGENRITIRDVLIGEVWVCSGQSNMQWSLRASERGEQDIPAADHPEIRLFAVPRRPSFTPEEDCAASWQLCEPKTAADFSAVAYYFGRDLHRRLGVPIGLIHSSWGGSNAEAWMPPSALEGVSGYEMIVTSRDRARSRQQEWDRQRRALPELLTRWRHQVLELDPGIEEGKPIWAAADLDDSRWQTMRVPGLARSVGLGGFDGSLWLRRRVEIPESWRGQELTLDLGPIDDQDITYFDGVRVGSHEGSGQWRTPRSYRIPPARALPGAHVITVRVLDTGGAAGLTGKESGLELRPAGAKPGAGLALAGDWRLAKGVALGDLPPRPSAPNPAYNRIPTCLYHGMLVPLLPYRIRGVIWYQGESNAPQAYQYRRLFRDMIRSWRRAWGQGDFPFYYVQLAPYRYGRGAVSHELREAQRVTLSEPNTGMVVTLDIGNPADIHPRNKHDVGARLALWARAKTYGESDLVHSGPLFSGSTLEGRGIRLAFEHAGSGLVTRDGKPPSHFVVAGEDQVFHPADAVIEGATVLVSSSAVVRPVAARHAWSNVAEPNLANAEGLPASSFRTDEWEAVTALAARMKPRGYEIPTIDLDGETRRQVVVDREVGQYLGHPTTVLLEDGRTMIAVYPKGHGRGAIVMKRSTDAGLTWSERLPVPESWATSQEVPTIYRVVDRDGTRRLILFSGLYPIRMAVSEDDGATWSELEPIGDFGGIVAMSDVVRLANGDFMALFHDDGRFIQGPPRRGNQFFVYRCLSKDGGLTWSKPDVVTTRQDAALCEPGVIRSPDGKRLAMLLRENDRKYNSMIVFSDDEGQTWTAPRELPASLTGDRHQLRHAPDGRIFASFRDTTHESPTQGDWVGWIGTWQDLVSGGEGQCRIRFKDNHNRWDCAYPAIALLPDGTFVVTTYGHWDPGESPYILSVRFRMDEIDARLGERRTR